MTQSTELMYGWWEQKRRSELPTTLGHPKNFVLSVEELQEYYNILQAELAVVQKEAAAVRLQQLAMTKGTTFEMRITNAMPRCTTLVNILEHVIARGNSMLAVKQLLVTAAKKRADAREAELRG